MIYFQMLWNIYSEIEFDGMISSIKFPISINCLNYSKTTLKKKKFVINNVNIYTDIFC